MFFLLHALPNEEVNKQAHPYRTILPVVLSQLLLITTTRCSAHSKEGLNRTLGREQGIRSRSSFSNSSQIFLKQRQKVMMPPELETTTKNGNNASKCSSSLLILTQCVPRGIIDYVRTVLGNRCMHCLE